MPDVLQQLTANPWILDFRASSLTTTPGAAITIRFDSQGTLSGATPCGSYRARFTLNESALRIRRIVGQREACAAGSSVVEQAYLTKLRLVDNVVPTGRDHLKLEGARDTRLAYNIHGLR
jgi:heat shock protein HslJ